MREPRRDDFEQLTSRFGQNNLEYGRNVSSWEIYLQWCLLWSCHFILVLLSCLYWVFLFSFYISWVARVAFKFDNLDTLIPGIVASCHAFSNAALQLHCHCSVSCRGCGLQHVFLLDRQNWPYFVQSLHQQNWHSHPGLVLLWYESLEIHILIFFFFFFLAVLGLNDWNSSNRWIFSTLLQEN